MKGLHERIKKYIRVDEANNDKDMFRKAMDIFKEFQVVYHKINDKESKNFLKRQLKDTLKYLESK